MNFLYLLGPLYLSAWDNNEIRYSLRSLDKAYPVDWLGITGPEVPAFLSGITHIKVRHEPMLGKCWNTQRQTLDACLLPGTPEHLVLMNDDFIVRAPWSGYTTHRGPLQAHRSVHRWTQSLTDTRTWLQARGIADPLCFEGHTPMPFEKSKAIPILYELLSTGKDLQFRSAYGNLTGVKGVRSPNAKRRDPAKWPEDFPFWSLSGTPTGKAMRFLEKSFPAPSRWEV